MQALERMRRSSLRQLDITLAMATGLVAYLTCGATRQDESSSQNSAFNNKKPKKYRMLLKSKKQSEILFVS